MPKTQYASRPPAGRRENVSDVGALASRMAHEIRNPLNAIRMQATVIRVRLSDPTPANLKIAHEQLDRLEQEVVRLNKLATSILDFGRPPGDERERIDLCRLVREITEWVRPEFVESRITVNAEFAHSGAELPVLMDKSKLRQVLHNLFRNAKEAMPDGGVLTVRTGERFGSRATVQVTDTGSGIAREHLPHIFDPFFSTKHRGDGLGLAIARQIVEGAGGFVSVESHPGKGTSFEIVLPVIEPQYAAAAPEAEAS
jgi:signal transduction histidine kinase